MTNTSKLNAIVENHINGNITDCKEQIRKLTKAQIIELVVYWIGIRGSDNSQDFYQLLSDILKLL